MDAGQPRDRLPGARLWSDIFVQPIDGGAPKQLTHFPADGQQVWRAAWSSDGKRIAVARAAVANNIVLFWGTRALTALGRRTVLDSISLETDGLR